MGCCERLPRKSGITWLRAARSPPAFDHPCQRFRCIEQIGDVRTMRGFDPEPPSNWTYSSQIKPARRFHHLVCRVVVERPDEPIHARRAQQEQDAKAMTLRFIGGADSAAEIRLQLRRQLVEDRRDAQRGVGRRRTTEEAAKIVLECLVADVNGLCGGRLLRRRHRGRASLRVVPRPTGPQRGASTVGRNLHSPRRQRVIAKARRRGIHRRTRRTDAWVHL